MANIYFFIFNIFLPLVKVFRLVCLKMAGHDVSVVKALTRVFFCWTKHTAEQIREAGLKAVRRITVDLWTLCLKALSISSTSFLASYDQP